VPERCSSGKDLGLLDQIVFNAVGDDRMNLGRPPGQHEARDELLIHDDRSDLDAIANLGMQARAPFEERP